MVVSSGRDAATSTALPTQLGEQRLLLRNVSWQLLTIRWLVDGCYVQKDTSAAFPNLPLTIIPEFIGQSLTIGEAKTVKAFRNWVQEHIDSDR